MADALTGVSTTREIYLEDEDGPVTGAALTYTLTGPAQTVLVAAQTVTAGADAGWYLYELDGSTLLTLPGLYRELWQGSAGTADVYRQAWFLVRDPVGPLLTRLDLRHDLARQVGDLWLGQAESGSGTTLVDSGRAEPTDHWGGAHLYLYAGQGRGQSRLVSTSSPGALVVGKAWVSAAPSASTYYELHRKWDVDAYNAALNRAIAAPEYQRAVRLRIVDESLTQLASTYEYRLPMGLAYLAEVWSRDPSAATNDWKLLSWPAREWAVLPSRTLRLTSPIAGYKLRLVGQMRPDALYDDRALCDGVSDWLLDKAAAILWRSKVQGPQHDRDAAIQQVSYYEQLTAGRRPHSDPPRGGWRVD